MFPALIILDRLCILFLIYVIIYSTLPNFKRSLKILMEGNLRRTRPSPSPVRPDGQEGGPGDRRGPQDGLLKDLGPRRKLLLRHGPRLGGTSTLTQAKNASVTVVQKKIAQVLVRTGIKYWAIQVWLDDSNNPPIFKDKFLEDPK